MNNHNNYFVIVLLLFSSCLCEIINLSNNQREKFLTGFVEHYNNLPNQIYQSNEGILRSVQQVDDITFIIVAEIKATEIRDVEAFKNLECTATVQESGDDDVTIINHVCQELVPSTTPESTEDYRDTETQVEVTEGTVTSRHVQLENEVQSDTAVTSGEQFIAIPRDQPSSPCVGCTSHVNPQAPGVSDLAALGVRHLDLHEPSINHSLDTVIDVERQVQVVNGVRYILTLLINSNNCTDVQTENCNFPKTCKVTILVKPWIKLPNGQNHRSILANNCTEPWLYGSDGEVLPEPSGDHDIQVRHHTDVQSVPNQERTLTEQELLSIQEQIIPNSEFKEPTEPTRRFDTSSNTLDVSKQHVFKVESNKQTENSVAVTESEKTEQQSYKINLDTDKKKAIDDMLDFFDFSGFKPKTETEDVISRVRRSYDDDLQVLSLAKDYHGIKKSIENARFMYEMAQAMVDYLNEMDMEVKNRAVKDVVKAEDETENLQRFVYIQARVTIPCDKVECRPTDVVTQICNGVIDSTNLNSPQILNTFCYNENKERDFREVVREVPLDDPILKNLAEEALKKIETESKSQHAMKISKIVSANTQLTSGTLTKFSVVIENINCKKSVPLVLRMNCTVLQQPGSKICEVIVHERRWLNERKISYTCTDRPVEMRISKTTSITNNVTVDDPKVVEMLQEAIQYLETQAVKNNKQKIVNINSISSQIIAGFLTKIEFVVGYTNCTDESKTRVNAFQKCEVLKDEALRLCKAQIWDRSWIMDGRQVEVSCDDVLKSNEVQSARNKRSIDSIGGSVRRSGSKDNQIDYKKLAEDSLQKFMLTSANRQHYVVLKVEKVKTQDEPGKLIRLLFSISPTNCFIERDGMLSSPKCDVVNPKNTFHCSSKVLLNVWIDKNQYFTDCNVQHNDENKNSDEIKERNLSNKKYYQLAEESLKKYMQNTEHTQNHKVVRLEKVTTQIVSGLLTNIDFIISPITQAGISNRTIKCHSKILEKQWLGTKDFNVSCQLKNQKKNQKKNLKNPKYMQMAVEALEKYIQNKPEPDLLRVTFVDKVEEGEGKSFNIRFMASHNEDNDGDTLCYVQFPETQIPKKNMNVECHSIGTVLKQIQITEDDPKFIKYVQWAEESLNDYLQSMNSSQLYTIVRIESVNVLWDDSVKTLINFIISPIDIEYSALQGKICQAEIKEQPWLNKKSKNVKCEPDEELYRAKRQVPGGITENDPKDSAYMQLAKESLRKYLLENPHITQSSEVDPVVERVTTQVVAGSMTRIDFHFQASGTDSQQDHVTMKCHAKVWERKWLNSKEINVTCFEDKAKVRRDLSGEITEQDPKNPHYMDLAEQSLRKYLLDNPQDTPALEVALVEKVTTQSKSGFLTRIDFIVLSRNDPITMFCNSEVSEQPSLNKVDIKVSCPKIFKTSLAGGLTLQDPSKPEYKLLAVESLQKYVRESEYADVYEVTSVDKVTSQVVAGSLTRINFQATSSQTGKAMKCHSAIVEQPWLSVKNVNVSCYKANQRQRRSLPGGKSEQDPKDPAYMELAKQSLRKYLLENPHITQSSEVDPVVERVTTQVVAGSMTRIDFHFQASGTDSQQDHVTMKCHAKVWERKWLNSKEINVTCFEDKAKVRRDLSGEITEQDPKNPHYMDLAEQSLRKYLLDNPQDTPALEVALVKKVTTQGKSGSLTRIDFIVLSRNDPITMFCNSEVSEQPSLNKVDIKVSCPKIFKTSLAGGLTLQDPSKPEYKLLAVESLQKYVRESEYADVYEVTSVDKVTSQVVAGSLTRINFQATSSQTGKAMKCHSAIVEQPWLSVKNVNVSCYKANQRQRRSLPGGKTEKDPKDPAYMELAKQSLRKYLLENPRITQSSEVDPVVERVTTQVVAGSMTRIDFHFQASGTDSQQDHVTMKCHAKVWERKWLNSKEINVTCFEDKAKVRRDLSGEITEQDPKNPHYMDLAEQSLRKYLLDNPQDTPALEVALVKKVTTQGKSGSLTRIDFIVLSRNDPITMFCNSEVSEQPSLNKVDIKVSCPKIFKTSLAGGLTLQDPSKPEYKLLAVESLQKYVRESEYADVYEVTSVDKVTSQVVAGSLTRINFQATSSQTGKAMKCHSAIVEQPWLSVKNVNVSCYKANQRQRRSLPGGKSEQDPKDPAYMELAKQSLRKYLLENPRITQSSEVDPVVERVTTQVVAGSMTRIDFHFQASGTDSQQDHVTMKCHAKVWERKWLNSKEITVSCFEDKAKVRRDLSGEITEQDPKNPHYMDLAEQSLRKYLLDNPQDTPALEVALVKKVTTQGKSGSLTRFDFIVLSRNDPITMFCNSEVSEQPSLNKVDIKVSCPKIFKTSLAGGLTLQDPSKPEYKLLAVESLQKYVRESEYADVYEVTSVDKVTSQVVAGSLTRINFQATSSQTGKAMKCHSAIVEQPWLSVKNVNVSCYKANQRQRRSLPGGETEKDPKDPAYMELAKQSLRKYLLENPRITQSSEVDPVVERVTTQVVAGSMTRIDFHFQASGTDSQQDHVTMKCHAKVWERKWLNSKEINVTCFEDKAKVRRDLSGEITEQDPKNPHYMDLAEQSLRKYLLDNPQDTPALEVALVKKVTTQGKSGSLTRIDFIVLSRNDPITMFCNSEVSEQPSLNKVDIKVSCPKIFKTSLAGGLTLQDPSKPEYKLLAVESLQKYVRESEYADVYEVTSVDKVTSQVVAGSLTRINFQATSSQTGKAMKCHSAIVEQPWLSVKNVNVSCYKANQRQRRSLPGGKSEQDPKDPAYMELAKQSLRKYLLENPHITQSSEVDPVVERVTTQVVAGSMTRIDFHFQASGTDSQQDHVTMKCHAKVWERKWLNSKEINVTCFEDKAKVRRDLSGEITEQDPKNPHYMDLAEQSLRKYLLDNPQDTPALEVALVKKVTTQGKSGSLTRIDFIVLSRNDPITMFCNSEVSEQPSLNKVDIKVSCPKIFKTSLAGGLTLQDPSKPEYKLLAVESLQKYVRESEYADVYEVTSVDKVTSQVVAGSLTRINFQATSSQTGKAMKCHSAIVEQPWLSVKNVNVSCYKANQRQRRSLPGGKSEQDPKDPAYMELAKQSLRKYLLENPHITQSSEVDPVVERVTTQVVAGSMTRIDFRFQASGTDSQQDHVTMKCHAEVWERPWLEPKAEFSVSCANADKRVKRHLKVPSHSMKHNAVALNYEVLDDEKNGNQKERDHVNTLRGHTEEVKDPSQPEYKILAEEALRKYELKSTVYHKVVEVKRVVTRVVSGLKYNINFNAAPTTCLLNVTSARARSCKPVADVILYCHTEIWDRPWLKRKKIDVNCYADDSEESDIDLSSKLANANSNSSGIYLKLAEEASEKYLTTSNRKYVHKVTEILSVSEQVTKGSLITIAFSLSPTTCLRNDTTKKSCNLKQPLVVFHCSAEIRNSSSLEHEKEIEVTCNKRSEEKNKKEKRDIGTRHTRQTGDDDDEIDEETTFYYADRAIQHMNDNSNSNNLHKLISIHGVQSGIQMGTVTVQMYLEVAETFCLRHNRRTDLKNCEEMNGLNHRLCLARLWPSPDDELVVRHVNVVCDDEENFESITGVNIPELLKMSIEALERPPEAKYKLVHQGEPQVIPSLDSKFPFKLNFVIATTNCSKDVNLDTNPFQCYINTEIPAKSCHSFIWLETATKFIRYISAKCTPLNRARRSSLDLANVTLDNSDIQKMVQASLEKLEMTSLHRYKQRVLQINSYSTKITSGKVTTIDFDVGYTSCLKYEWVANITSCDFLEHLPRRRCVAQIWERLWINNGQNIDVSCVDDETPLEAHIEFESAEMANELAREALKHIEAKYPHPNKQKVVRIFSLEKQVVAGIHYKMKVEVGFTDCVALSDQTDCKLLKDQIMNRFCRVNVWVRPWTDHPPNFRVSCDFQEATTYDLYHHVQAEHLFYNFLTTYNPSYVNDYSQMQKRFEIFKQNIKKIHELNVHEKGTATYGVTRFADLSYEEFRSTYMGLKTNLTNENQVPMKMADIPDIKVPVNFDWREFDAVTEVKDQGSCGSCWAFSVTGNIEGQWKMQSGKLVSLSEQELVDCDKMDDGCNGGLPDNAYRAIEQMGGLELESDYPYEGVDEKCVFNKTLAKVQISGAVNITKNETGMAQWLVHNGPISIGINANAMQFYMGGISHPWKMLCNPTNLDHGVLIVGYGIKDYPLFHKKLPYWIVKNSWGKSWGEQGYYRVYRGDGTCGVNQMASSAII